MIWTVDGGGLGFGFLVDDLANGGLGMVLGWLLVNDSANGGLGFWWMIEQMEVFGE